LEDALGGGDHHLDELLDALALCDGVGEVAGGEGFGGFVVARRPAGVDGVFLQAFGRRKGYLGVPADGDVSALDLLDSEFRHLKHGMTPRDTRHHYPLPKRMSVGQQPRICGPGWRQWAINSSSSQPLSINASAKMARRALSRAVLGDRCRG